MADLALLAAFIAGLSSCVSPCTLALVPVFLAYLAGVSGGPGAGLSGQGASGGTTARANRFALFLNTICFVLGFTVVFILLGAAVGAVTSGLAGSQMWLARIGGGLMIAFGLVSLGLVKIPALQRARGISGVLPGQNIKYLGSFIVGSTIAVGWSPCVGPILGGILALAGTSGSTLRATTLLLAYSGGMMLPFLALGLFSQGALGFIRSHRRLFQYTSQAAGVLLIALGIIVFTDRLRQVTSYLFISPM
ncbi:MAG: cytochrome c biogenesis protein CcdA [SAR202 cluster bacterium]|nr:cytochrome c biogenesis protein CcdA [SAR202 cluster bacterium]